MEILRSGFDILDFFDTVKKSAGRVLMLDYDGTLAPFTPERNKAYPYDSVRDLLDLIIESGKTKLVIISGRAICDLIPLLGVKKLPEIWGSHGSERLMPDGSYEVAKLNPLILDRFNESDRWFKEVGIERGYEKKPVSRAIHLRGESADVAREIEEKVIAKWKPLTDDGLLTLFKFDGGVELKAPGENKSIAVNTILADIKEDSAIAYLGDDLTDEDAFGALRGIGLSVLVRTTFRPTLADIWIKPPGELIEFFENWINYS